MNTAEFKKIIRTLASQDTSADPSGWTKDNPLWGHCAVVALLAQDVFGGNIIRGGLEDHSRYAYLRSHFWNDIPECGEIDFTAEQYPDLTYSELLSEPRDRPRILAYPDTVRRYALLKDKFERFLKMQKLQCK